MINIGRHKKEELYCPFCESDYTYIREEKLSVLLIGGDTYFYVLCDSRVSIIGLFTKYLKLKFGLKNCFHKNRYPDCVAVFLFELVVGLRLEVAVRLHLH